MSRLGLPVPRSVTLLGLGPSKTEYANEVAVRQGAPLTDEVWGINAVGGVFKIDRLFAIDDLREVEKKWPAYGDMIRRAAVPTYTSQPYPEFPHAIEYPIQEVAEFIGLPTVFINTSCYALAYAMFLRVPVIYIFGCDFTYQDKNVAERGGQGMAFLLGMCPSLDIQFRIAETSNLMCASSWERSEDGRRARFKPYGYYNGYAFELDVPSVAEYEGKHKEIGDGADKASP